MLHNQKFEPAVGAEALHEAETVKIHQRLPGGWFLILGRRGPKRVQADDLQPPAEPDLLTLWLSERTYAGSDRVVTPVALLRADFHDWLDRQNLASAFPLSPNAFTKAMRHTGHAPFLAKWREPGETCSRVRSVCPLLLKGAA